MTAQLVNMIRALVSGKYSLYCFSIRQKNLGRATLQIPFELLVHELTYLSTVGLVIDTLQNGGIIKH